MKKFFYVSLLALGVVAMMTPPPAMAQEEKPFVLHGEVRFRGDYSENVTDFDSDLNDSGIFWPYRVRIAAEGKFGKNLGVWIEFQNTGEAGNGGPFRAGSELQGIFGPVGDFGGGAQLYQGAITIGNLWTKGFSARIGRQEIVMGNELLLGDLDFYSGISHDGLTGNWVFDKWNLALWYTRPFENNATGGNALPPDFGLVGGGGNINFWGGYATWTFSKKHSFDVYLMDLGGNDQSLQTLGGRYSHDNAGSNGLFWNIEYAIQMGENNQVGNLDYGGSVAEGWIGWNFKAGKNNHRIYLRGAQASGDDDPLDGDDDEFHALYGDFHNRLGRGDWFRLSGGGTSFATSVFDTTTVMGVGGTSGITALAVGYNGFFGDKQELGAQLWDYSADVENGAGDDDLGSAIDIWYGYTYNKNLNFTVSYSQLSPGDALSGGGADDSVNRFYGNARFRF